MDKQYIVKWENEVDAKNPMDAARECFSDIALGMSLGFTVIDVETKKEYLVDLSDNSLTENK